MQGRVPILLTFVTGFLTLASEIVAGRVLAPYFGSSIYQWAGLIGVALIAYCLGYISWRFLTAKGVAWPMIIGGVYLLGLPLWILAALKSLLSLSIFPAAVSGALITLGVPSLLWATILPWALSERRQESGAILASSTVGSLVGAWSAAFVFLPSFGTRACLVGLSIVSVIAGLIFIKPRKRVSRFGAAGLLLVIVSIALGICRETGAIIREPWRISDMFELGQGEQGVERRLIEFKDSGYQLIAVWDEMKNGVIERVLMLGGLTQFIWNRDNSLLKYRDERYSYYNYATATALLTAKNPPENALFIGLGGGLIPFQVKRIFPEIKMSAYELDPEVERVARLHLPLSELPNVRVRIGDGRQLLNEEANATTRGWDMILIDTFLNAYVPFHLTTREFFKLAYDRAAPGGLVVCDTHSIFQSTGLLEKLEATISSVFDETYALSLTSGSTLLLAFKRSVEESSSGILEGRLKRPCQVGEICKYLADIKQTLGTDRLKNLSQLAQRHDLYLTDDRNDTEIRLYKTRASLFIERPL